MKCKECDCCKKGWFKSKPKDYVCTGVYEPFVINDINVECTEYPELRNKKFPTEDLLVVGFDNANNGDDIALTVTRIHKNKAEVIDVFYNTDAIKMYRKLTKWQ